MKRKSLFYFSYLFMSGLICIIILSISCNNTNISKKNSYRKKAPGHPSLIPAEERINWPKEKGLLMIPKKEQIPDKNLYILEKDSSEYAYNASLYYVLVDTVYLFDAHCHFFEDSFYVEDFIYNISRIKVLNIESDKIEYNRNGNRMVIYTNGYEKKHIHNHSYDNIHQGLFGPYGEEYHSHEPIEPYPSK